MDILLIIAVKGNCDGNGWCGAFVVADGAVRADAVDSLSIRSTVLPFVWA
jgi:hypothetical protein